MRQGNREIKKLSHRNNSRKFLWPYVHTFSDKKVYMKYQRQYILKDSPIPRHNPVTMTIFKIIILKAVREKKIWRDYNFQSLTLISKQAIKYKN